MSTLSDWLEKAAKRRQGLVKKVDEEFARLVELKNPAAAHQAEQAQKQLQGSSSKLHALLDRLDSIGGAQPRAPDL